MPFTKPLSAGSARNAMASAIRAGFPQRRSAGPARRLMGRSTPLSMPPKQTLNVRLPGDPPPTVSHLEDLVAAWDLGTTGEMAWNNAEGSLAGFCVRREDSDGHDRRTHDCHRKGAVSSGALSPEQPGEKPTPGAGRPRRGALSDWLPGRIYVASREHAAESQHAAIRLEARAVAALNHPNLVAVYDVGQRYIVSDWWMAIHCVAGSWGCG